MPLVSELVSFLFSMNKENSRHNFLGHWLESEYKNPFFLVLSNFFPATGVAGWLCQFRLDDSLRAA